MKTIQITIVVGLVLMAMSVSQAIAESGKSKFPRHPNALSQEELRLLFSDKTVLSETVGKKRQSITYYAPNGEVRQERKGRKRSGFWRATSDGWICLQMQTNAEKCRIIVREADGRLVKYIVKKNGLYQATVNYKKFWSGNPRGL